MIRIYSSRGYDKSEKYGELEVTGASRISVLSGWTSRKRFLYASEFVYVTEGELHLRIGTETLNIGKNQCTVCPVYATIDGARPSEKNCSFYVVEFSDSGTDISGFFENRIRTLSEGTAFVEEMLKRIHTTYIRSSGPSPVLDAMFCSLLCEIRDRADKARKTDLPVREMIDYIESHVSEPLDASVLCQKFGYNTDYMSKVFRTQCGMSIKKYINAVKLQTAKRLLTSTRMTVSRIGSATGFDDVTLFYKFFRYHEGITPSEYRKRYK